MQERRSILVESVVIALAYFAASLIAIQLTASPGYASAIWPAAGIALVAVLRRTSSGVLGTWLGSTLLNFYNLSGSAQGLMPLDALAMATSIGGGNALQAWVGAMLVRRHVTNPRLLQSGRDVLNFILLGGAVACMISPTIGVGVQRLAGFAPAEVVVLRWTTWWAGAALGVALFAPLTMIVLGRREEIWRRRGRSVGLPVLIALLATVIACRAVEHWEAERIADRHAQRIESLNASLYEQLERHRKSLIAMAGFFEFSDHVTHLEFRRMAQHLSKLAEHANRAYWFERPPGLEDIAALPIEPAFTSGAIDQDGDESDDDGFLAELEDAERVPAVSAETLREAMLQSVRVDQPVMTPPVQWEDGDESLHVISAIVTGIYRPKSKLQDFQDAAADRAARLRGFVVYEVDLDCLAGESSVADHAEGLQTIIYDATDPSRAPLAVRISGPQLAAGTLVRTANDSPGTGMTGASSTVSVSPEDSPSWISFAGRVLAVRSILPDVASQRTVESWTVLICGLALSSLLAGFLLVLSGHAAQVEQLVEERTAELRSVNECLAGKQRSVQRMNRDLKRSRDAARAATRAKAAFLANMSHEIRTPMTAILGFTELMADPGTAPDRREEFAQVVRRNGEHLLTLINDILDVSKIDAGKLKIERVRCEVTTIVGDVASLLQMQAAQKGIELIIDPVPDVVPQRIRTDPTRVRQVLLNLLSNAIKFTERGSVKLSTTLLHASGEPGQPCRIRFQVSDTGIGMQPSQVKQLFRPFSQADVSTTRRYGGTGLGLTISRRLAELLGGRISVESEPGRGSTFTFDISAEIARVGGVSGASPGRVAARSSPVTELMSRRARALVIDDGEDNRALIRVLLGRMGVEVAEAVDGRDGVEKVLAAQQEGTPFDLILLDMQMPVMDGWQAARALRARGVRTPLVAVTAGALADDRDKCIAAGCDEYTSKPINPGALRELVERFALPSKDVPNRIAA